MIRILFTILILLSHLTLFAQNNEDSNRPKIGLVLSGGGAKGFAYVGVLKAMEEAGIRPDYITGTSIGSIVGGLYAIGYTPDQLDTIIRSVNWDLILSNNVPLTYISYEEKEYYNRYLITLPFVDKKLTLPSGVIEGQMLSDLLNQLTWPAMKYESFDEFPIPFRCVATDVSTGKTIVFKDGSLAKALRASMSIPSAFTAVDLDSTLAVDGGILNNFPVNEVKKMGAEYIIGLNVSDKMANAKEIGSLTGILTQVSMFESLKRMNDDIDSCDFYIKLDLEGYGVSSFGNSKEILEIGDKIGNENAQKFKDLAKQLNINSKNIDPVKLTPDSIIIRDVVINGNERVPKKLILSKLNIPLGIKVSQKEVEEGILRVYGINNFKKVLYSIHHISKVSEDFVLKIIIEENPPASLKASVHYDNTFSAGVVLNVTLRNILGRGSRALVIGDISENPRFRFDYLKYFGARERFAINFMYDFSKLDIPQYEEGKKIDVEGATNNIFSLGILTTHSLKHAFLGGIAYSSERSKSGYSNILPSEIKYFELNGFQIGAGAISNSMNDRNYPTKGSEAYFYAKYHFNNRYKLRFQDGVDTVYFNIDGETVPATQSVADELVNEILTPEHYGKLYFRYDVFYPLSKNFQIIPATALGLIISDEKSTSEFSDFNIGGNQMVNLIDTRLAGLHFAELVMPNLFKLGLKFQNVIWKNIYLKYGVDLLAYYPYVPIDQLSLFSFSDMIDNYSMIGYGVQIRYKSIIGPISLGLTGNSRDNHLRVYFQLGFSMNLND